MAKLTLIQGGTIVTMNSTGEIIKGDILIEDKRIKKIAKKIKIPKDKKVQVVDASNQFVIPGLIQNHIHLCQTLARGDADDMVLLKWLKTSIWPMESHHNKKSIQASAELSILEMQKAGTTTILDMATVHHTNDLLEAVANSGLRYWGGKCLMDEPDRSGPLYQKTIDGIKETEDLISEWKNKNDLIEYAICPRFAVSCTQEILEASASLSREHNLFTHTHASESIEEIELIKDLTGLDNIMYLDKVGLIGPKNITVHGVHMTEEEVELMAAKQAPLIHCPSSNLKLASGIAPTEKYVNEKMIVGIGADGAPCNNNLDPFLEIRLAALLQKPHFGPEAMPAKRAFEMATIQGARVLGMENEIGSLEEGKLADIVTVSRSYPHSCTIENPYSSLVYSTNSRDVQNVMINGKWVVRNSKSKIYDENIVMENAIKEKKKLLKRAEA